ncbi:MAG: acetyl-CoA carboxylase carboxyltransferase subunit alpha [Deltaproteobacteria bacterium RBG_16_54_11]|jgi:acetyl-CoA carboxylase carboxyl transferase subunit alpha|nr:MAG: acetyl-CoA carboxylase carboxyltransferase subunit alpha [Deltaproteobacteria bacterium RBG_16_54_11]
MVRHYLDFEKPLRELEREYEELRRFAPRDDPRVSARIEKLEKRITKVREETYAQLTPWQRTQLSRHIDRPHTLDYIRMIFEDFIELHGDRGFMDDPAMVGGLARLDGEAVVVLGHQKGRDVKEMGYRNFGMSHPEGYRKALRIMELGVRFNKPIVTMIDTPGAYPGVGAEERGQAGAIAHNLREMAAFPVPIVVVVIGEGGSGGALAIGVGDRILMMENAIYSVISPEGCAAILWRDGTKGPLAAEALKITAADLLNLEVIDEIIPEPFGGAHRDYEGAAATVKEAVVRHLRERKDVPVERLLAERYQRFRRMGSFLEE